MDSVKQKIIQNSFFIWLNSIVLLLTSIPTHHFLRGTWHIEKNYEIGTYALSIVLCALITFIYTYTARSSKQDLVRYKFFMLLYMPLAVILYSFVSRESSKFISVFILSLLGLGILGYDLIRPKLSDNALLDNSLNYLNKSFNYSQALVIFVAISAFLIAWQSTGNSFNIVNWKFILLLGLTFIFLNYIRIQTKYWFLLVPVFIFMATFLSMNNTIDYDNASFVIGPVPEVLYSDHHPLTISAQYGSGLASFIALYYKLIGFFYLDGLIYLLQSCMFIEYILVYLIALKFSRSHQISFLALVSVVIFNFYSMQIIYYTFPQIGFIRFGLIYLIILCYLFESKLPPRVLSFLVSSIASIAAIWSFESAVYVIPAVLFTELINKNLRQFLPIFLGCFVATLIIYLFPLYQQGQLHALTRFYEYANLYAIDSESFFAVPISRLTSMWWLYPALYAFILIQILSGKVKNKIVILLTVYGLATFTYFGGRAHPNNLCIISIPFILLSVYTIAHLDAFSFRKKQGFLALFFSVFFVANYAITDFGNGFYAYNKMIISGIYSQNFPLFKREIKMIYLQSFPSKVAQFRQNCDKYAKLNKYVENNSLAILEYDLLGLSAVDVRLVDYYGCSHAYNAFGVSPYLATTINPKAMARVIDRAATVPNHYVLIDAKLLDKTVAFTARPMVKQVLRNLKAKEVDHFTIGKTTFLVFENNNLNHG